MTRVILYLLFLETFLVTDTVAPLGRIRLAYIGPPGIPSFPEYINIGDIEDIAETFTFNFSNVGFYYLSHAYFLKHRVDFDEQKVFTYLTCGKTQLQGRYSLFVPSSTNKTDQDLVLSSTNTTDQDFELSIYQLMLSYETAFQIQNGTVNFGEMNDYVPRINTVRSEVPADLRKYQPSKLFDAVSAKLYQAVHQKIGMDDIRSHINRHLAAICEHFKSSIFNVLDLNPFHTDIFDVVHFDTTDFKVDYVYFYSSYGGSGYYDFSVPTFRLSAQETFNLSENIWNITFAENKVLLQSISYLSSPRLVANIVYNRRDNPAETNTFEVEYQLGRLKYDFQMFASLQTATVGLEYSSVTLLGGVTRANNLNLWNVRGGIIEKLSSNVRWSSYIEMNCQETFSRYMRGIMADGRIAEEIFKDDQIPL